MASIPTIPTVLPTANNNMPIIGAASVVPPGSAPLTHRSLYVGDLHPTVTETILFERFSKIGPVSSIRVCRDAITRRSLCYAYVNFQNPEHAERAIETMNFEMLNNRPIRIMYSQRDPTLRRSTSGNIFIKNLDKRIDVKALYDTFTLFGKILSCKIAMDEEGLSKGYGFIHFESEESAEAAINKVNGMLLDGKKVHVSKFMPRAQRLQEYGESPSKFTNVFIKNFADLLDDDKLRALFSKFGTITSSVVVRDDQGKPKGWGFVSFDQPEEAAKAVEAMNDYELPGTDRKLTVCRAQKKAERKAELRREYEQWRAELNQKYKGSNLYVKNLEESVDDTDLRKMFEEYGTVASAKIMHDSTGRSKGFGFVCFSNIEEASKAKEALHNKMFGKKPLYVALAQRKEDRVAMFATRYMKQIGQLRLQDPTNIPGAILPAGGYFVAPQPVQNQTYLTGSIPNAPIFGGAQRWNPLPGYMISGQGFAARGPRPFARRNYGPPGMHRGNGYGQFRHQPRQGHPAAQAQSSPAQPVVNNVDPATFSQVLLKASPTEQKQMIGEKIYALIEKICPNENVGKITGMLLEMDVGELLHLIEDESVLKAKAHEAVEVLREAAKSINIGNSA